MTTNNNSNMFYGHFKTTQVINNMCVFIIDNIKNGENISNSIVKKFNDRYERYIENLFDLHNIYVKHFDDDVINKDRIDYFDELDKLEKCLSQSLNCLAEDYKSIKNVKDEMVLGMI